MKAKRRDPIAKDLRTPKYKMRVVQSKKKYCRKQKYFEKNLDLS